MPRRSRSNARRTGGGRSSDRPGIVLLPPTVSFLELLRWLKMTRISFLRHLIESQPALGLSEFAFPIRVVVARLQLPSESVTVPRLQQISADTETDPVFVEAGRYPFKVEFGDDEVLFMLRKDDDFRTFVDGLEKRSLDTLTCVEVRPSPLGGLGLFTTKDCLPGDLLLAERPMASTVTSCIAIEGPSNIHSLNFSLQ
jgi:hypothetical protein